MLKVRVKEIPVFYNGKRYLKGEEVAIENNHLDPSLFEQIEEIEKAEVPEEKAEIPEIPFKGIQQKTLEKALQDAKVEIPENADRETMIELLLKNGITSV